MMDQIAERKIAEAMARGELDDLPGAGRPLDLDDDKDVPEELRMAYRVLKNAGFAPEEVRQPGLLRLRIEGRYFRKVARALSARR